MFRDPTSRLVESVKSDCGEARSAIAGTFASGAVRIHADENPLYAWGQYIDVLSQAPEPDISSHFGIFGTAAAVQVLAMQSVRRYEVLIRDGVKVLPLVSSRERADSRAGDHESPGLGGPGNNLPAPVGVPTRQTGPEDDATRLPSHDEAGAPDASIDDPGDVEAIAMAHERFARKGDLRVVYKVSALLDVAVVLCRDGKCPPELVPPLPDLIDALLALRAPEGGWADFKSDEEFLDANAHATAVALLSLSRAPELGAEAESACLESLRWFVTQTIDHQSVATIAMLVAAINRLSRYETIKHARDVAKLLEESEKSLLEWVRRASPLDIRRSLEATEYRLPPDVNEAHPLDDFRFSFMLYLPHCLAGLAILESAQLRNEAVCRRFVLAIVKIVADGARNQRHFVAAGRNLVSTVEHLWLCRLLHAFHAHTVYGSWRAVLSDRIAERPTGPRTAVLSAALLITLVIAAAVTSGTIQVVFGALVAVVLALAGAVVVSEVKRIS